MEDLVFELAFEGGDGEKLQVDGAAVAVVMADVGDARADFCVDSEFFLEFASKGLFRAFAMLDFAAGKLPLQRHRLIGASLADQDSSVANQQPCDNKT